MLTTPQPIDRYPSAGHSAKVELWLEVPGMKISLTHAAAGYVVSNEKVNLAPCDGTVVYTVDGERVDCPVRLIDGMSETIRRTAIEPLPATPA